MDLAEILQVAPLPRDRKAAPQGEKRRFTVSWHDCSDPTLRLVLRHFPQLGDSISLLASISAPPSGRLLSRCGAPCYADCPVLIVGHVTFTET